MDAIPSRWNWCNGSDKSIFKNKKKIINEYMKMFFIRTNTMFEYDGLPETIPKEDYQLIKQRFGSATIGKANDDKLYAFYGGLGGEWNEYYHPTLSIVTNPYLKFNKNYKIGVDCVVIKNDIFYNGLYNINLKYAELLTECDISIRKCLLNIRVDNVLESKDNSQDESIRKFFENVENGDFGYITSKKLMDNSLMNIHNTASKTSNPLKDLIEMRNYIESCWWMEFGLNANYNMKRESLTDAETNADDMTMLPLIDQMLYEEQKGWDKVNKMFNLNVKVRLSAVWSKMRKDVLNDDKQDEPKDNEIEKGGDNDETIEDESNK